MKSGVAYPGETEQKRIARGIMYMATINALRRKSQFAAEDVDGDCVSLCGDSAAESRILQMIAQTCGGVPYLLDINPEYVAQNQGCGVPVLGCDVSTFLDAMFSSRRRLAFIHLDFMGGLGAAVEESVRKASRVLTPGGVLAVTFFRGRDNTRSWFQTAKAELANKQRDLACQGRDVSRLWAGPDTERFVGGLHMIKRWLGEYRIGAKWRHDQIYWARYQSTSPMGIIAVQRLPLSFPDTSHESTGGTISYEKTSVRDQALRFLRGSPSSSELVAALFNIDKRQLAAWRAVSTRRGSSNGSRARS